MFLWSAPRLQTPRPYTDPYGPSPAHYYQASGFFGLHRLSGFTGDCAMDSNSFSVCACKRGADRLGIRSVAILYYVKHHLLLLAITLTIRDPFCIISRLVRLFVRLKFQCCHGRRLPDKNPTAAPPGHSYCASPSVSFLLLFLFFFSLLITKTAFQTVDKRR